MASMRLRREKVGTYFLVECSMYVNDMMDGVNV